MNRSILRLKPWFLLWSTQSLSALGSAMTNFALVIWLYQKNGSALETALLSICSYAPYVMMSIFAGALSDRWDRKRTMLACDAAAASCTVIVLVLLKHNMLQPWHMYVINAVNGLMNTVQQPASEVAATLLVSKEYYQKTAGLRSFSNSLNTILTPVIATALYAFAGMGLVITVDLCTFALAFCVLAFGIRLPNSTTATKKAREPVLRSAATGLRWLRSHTLILKLILFLAFINLVASAHHAALPAMVLSRSNGGEQVLGWTNSLAGIATLAGSIMVTFLPAPKNRIRVICLSLMLSMSTENFLLSVGRTPMIWYIGNILGWLAIPLMNASLDVVFRTTIPAELQGRVFACRNTLQFFTIPLGYLLSGALIDGLLEPAMAQAAATSPAAQLFGTGKGAGAAAMLMILGACGAAICVVFTVLLRNERWTDTTV